jgi:hypothetical protein
MNKKYYRLEEKGAGRWVVLGIYASNAEVTREFNFLSLAHKSSIFRIVSAID